MDQTAGKGKGKAKWTANSDESSTGQDQKSIVERVIKSTAGLARDVIASSPQDTITGLSSLGSEKAISLGSVPAASDGSSFSDQASSSIDHAHHSNLGESFREIRSKGIDSEELEEFLEHRPAFETLQSTGSNQTPSQWASEFTEHKPPLHQQTHIELDNSTGEHYDDGAEVRALLSDPHFVAISDTYDTEELSVDVAAELFSQDFSEPEKLAVKKIRADLPEEPVHNPVSETNPLNLIPNFRDLQATTPQQDDLFASPISISHWGDVLNRYTDDVWGDLLPVVEKVKKQLDDAKSGANLDAKAIERLRMVLKHVNLDHRLDTLGIHNQGTFQSHSLSHAPNLSQSQTVSATTAGVMEVPTIGTYLNESQNEELREASHAREDTQHAHERGVEQSRPSHDS
jgi:hypothetical protein